MLHSEGVATSVVFVRGDMKKIRKKNGSNVLFVNNGITNLAFLISEVSYIERICRTNIWIFFSYYILKGI